MTRFRTGFMLSAKCMPVVAVGLATLLAGCGEQRFLAPDAPDFSLPSLGGEETISLGDHRGDVVYVSFWASWCEPCREEMPDLNKIHHELKGKGRILMLQGVPTASSAIDRTAGFNEALKQHPGLKVVAVKPADYLRAQAIQRIEEALAEKLQFDAIYSQSDSMALGAILALKKSGRDTARIPITGIDYISEAREAIRSGALNASFTYPTFGKEGAAAAMKLLRGGKPNKKEVLVESVAVTRKNVDKVAPIF